eukprot:sb/3471500/
MDGRRVGKEYKKNRPKQVKTTNQTHYLGHVTSYRPIRDQYFLIRYSCSTNKDRVKNFTSSVLRTHVRSGTYQEPTETNKQPIRTRYLGHVTGYQPIRDQYFLIRPVTIFDGCDRLTKILSSKQVSATMTTRIVETNKQPIRTHYLGHVTGYQPISDQYFLIRSVRECINPIQKHAQYVARGRS